MHPKDADGMVNSVDPDQNVPLIWVCTVKEQSIMGLHCLPRLVCPKILVKIIEPPHDKTNKNDSAPSEDSDQPGRPFSLNSLRCALNG